MEQGGGRVCVTGAGGFVASWLVKLLLSKGYRVHGTVRNPDDEKNNHLKSLEKAQENLLLFKADLLDYDSLYAAIEGCSGVFHVASPVPPSSVANPETELLEPAVRGTLNVLKACSETGVERVVVVSSTGAVVLNPNWPPNKPMDEDCWTDIDYCKESKVWLNWYCVAKTIAEREALKYAENTGLDVVTVCPSFVFGPLLQPTMNSSTQLFIDLLKGTEQQPRKLQYWVEIERERERERMEQGGGRVCVTGAGGFVASWLVKLLLSKGYMVHGTVRNPDDEKNNHFKSLEKAQENLQLYKADLLDYGSLYAAVEGCSGVFHVASPVPPSSVANPEARISSAI